MRIGTGWLGRARGSVTRVGSTALSAPSREPGGASASGGQVPAEGPPRHRLCHGVIFTLEYVGRPWTWRTKPGTCATLGPCLSSVISWARAAVNMQMTKVCSKRGDVSLSSREKLRFLS